MRPLSGLEIPNTTNLPASRLSLAFPPASLPFAVMDPNRLGRFLRFISSETCRAGRELTDVEVGVCLNAFSRDYIGVKKAKQLARRQLASMRSVGETLCLEE